MKTIFILSIVLSIFSIPAFAQNTPKMIDTPLKIDADNPALAWKFYNGREFPGADGTIHQAEIDGKKAIALAYDFTNGGNYVAACCNIQMTQGYSELRFQVHGSVSAAIKVRLIDGSGQAHQYDLSYDKLGEWQPLRIDLTGTKSKAQVHFGGANDGVLHWPLKGIQLLVHRSSSNEKTPGEISFAEIQAMP